MVQETYGEVLKAMDSDKHIYGLDTGFYDIDAITSGRVAGDLIIIAARPSMGKTSLMLQEVFNIAYKDKKPVGVFSLEMPFQQLIIKMVANDFRLDSNVIRSGKVYNNQKHELAKSFERLMGAQIYLNDISGINILELKSIARVWKQKHDIQALYVDYLQLIHADGKRNGNREQEVSLISQGLKAIAKDLHIPVIALSQLSRAVESREGKQPQLSDLRESGSIEQEADVVQLLFRADYYGIERDLDGSDLKGLVEVNIAKNRNGATGKRLLRFEKEISRFSNIANEKEMPEPSNYYERDKPF